LSKRNEEGKKETEREELKTWNENMKKTEEVEGKRPNTRQKK
jgi:hypothetical protein